MIGSWFGWSTENVLPLGQAQGGVDFRRDSAITALIVVASQSRVVEERARTARMRQGDFLNGNKDFR